MSYVDYNNIIDKLKDIISQELGNKKIYDKDIATALDINYSNFRKAKEIFLKLQICF